MKRHQHPYNKETEVTFDPQYALYLYFIVTLIAAITFILQLFAAQCLPNLGQQNIKRTREHFQISCL